MRAYVYALVSMATAWLFLRGALNVNAAVEGIFFAFLTLLFTRALLKQAIARRLTRFRQRLPWYLVYLARLTRDLVVGSVDVAYRALHPKVPVHPGILAVDVAGMSDIGVTMLANSINLTPGTLTIEVDMEKGLMFVHTINAVELEEVRQSIRMVAGPIRQVTR